MSVALSSRHSAAQRQGSQVPAEGEARGWEVSRAPGGWRGHREAGGDGGLSRGALTSLGAAAPSCLPLLLPPVATQTRAPRGLLTRPGRPHTAPAWPRPRFRSSHTDQERGPFESDPDTCPRWGEGRAMQHGCGAGDGKGVWVVQTVTGCSPGCLFLFF